MPKSNKTSHVLSLLVNDLEAEDPAASQTPHPEPPPTSRKKPRAPSKPPKAEQQTAAAPEKPPKVEQHTAATPEKPPKAKRNTAAAPEKPPRSGEEAVALNIRNALEEALEKEAEHSAESRLSAKAPENIPAEPAVRAKPEPRPFVPPAFEPAPEESEAPFVPVPKPASQPAGAPEPPAPARAPAVYPSVPEGGEPFCFNVMQALVEAKASRYIDQFGVCSCPRCRTDVIALALSRLPSKYVVATHSDLVSLLSVYEDKYNAAVVSQLMRACNRVAEKPRHMRA